MSQSSLVLYASHRFPAVRMGITSWIRKMPLFEYAELEIFDGEQAMLAILRHQPDIAILDINLPKMNAMEIAEMLQRNHSNTRIILWGDSSEFNPVSEVKIQSFGLSLLTMEDDQNKLRDCFAAIKKGGNYISKIHQQGAVKEKTSNASSLRDRFAHVAIKKLTDREKKVMQLISGGSSTLQIADQLCLSQRTIDSYRLKISKKLNLKGKHTLMLFAHENKDVWNCL